MIEDKQDELTRLHADAATVVHALDAAIQFVEVLILFLPDGQPLHPQVATAQGALDEAMRAVRYPRANPALKIAAANIARLCDHGAKMAATLDKTIAFVDVLLDELRHNGITPSAHLVVARNEFDRAIRLLFAER